MLRSSQWPSGRERIHEWSPHGGPGTELIAPMATVQGRSSNAPHIPALQMGLWEPNVPKTTVLGGGKACGGATKPCRSPKLTFLLLCPNPSSVTSSGPHDNPGRGGKHGFTQQARGCKSQAELRLTPQFLQAPETHHVPRSTSQRRTSRNKGLLGGHPLAEAPAPHASSHLAPDDHLVFFLKGFVPLGCCLLRTQYFSSRGCCPRTHPWLPRKERGQEALGITSHLSSMFLSVHLRLPGPEHKGQNPNEDWPK